MSKQGYTSNHGMSIVDVKLEIIKQDMELVKDNKGIKAWCPFCGTEFNMSKKDYELYDAYLLVNYFRKHKCPYCVIVSDELEGVVQHNFVTEAKEFVAVKIPAWFLRLSRKIQKEKAAMKK